MGAGKSKGWLREMKAKSVLLPIANSEVESQRDSDSKPRVASIELPWEARLTTNNANGVAACRRPGDATPLGLKSPASSTQGSSFLATLGWTTQSRWDCRTTRWLHSIFRKALKFVFIVAVLAALPLLSSLPACAAEPRVLVYQKNGKGFVHDNLTASAAALQELRKQNGFGVDVSANAAVFVDETLKQYRALIFANSNNEAFENDDQRAAFQRYLRSGGGFVGIHSSTGSERQWAYFQRMQGAKFLRHAPLQKFTIDILDAKHPATAHLGSTWPWTDECYFFTNMNPDIRVLLAVDTRTLRDPKLETEPGQKSNGVFPLAWCHEFDGGRRFYTSLGHKIEHYSDPVFRQHLLGGIRWVMGETAAEASRPPP